MSLPFIRFLDTRWPKFTWALAMKIFSKNNVLKSIKDYPDWRNALCIGTMGSKEDWQLQRRTDKTQRRRIISTSLVEYEWNWHFANKRGNEEGFPFHVKFHSLNAMSTSILVCSWMFKNYTILLKTILFLTIFIYYFWPSLNVRTDRTFMYVYNTVQSKRKDLESGRDMDCIQTYRHYHYFKTNWLIYILHANIQEDLINKIISENVTMFFWNEKAVIYFSIISIVVAVSEDFFVKIDF